jgi:uncharacterized protein
MGLIRILQLALIGLLIWLGMRAVKRWMHTKSQSQIRAGKRASSPEVMDVMVQDPQCGTYLPKHESVRAWTRGEERFFCSKACRDAYLAGKEPEQK